MRRKAISDFFIQVCKRCRFDYQLRHPVNISYTFSQREFTAALQHLKPGKASGPDSIGPELILHAGAALKS